MNGEARRRCTQRLQAKATPDCNSCSVVLTQRSLTAPQAVIHPVPPTAPQAVIHPVPPTAYRTVSHPVGVSTALLATTLQHPWPHGCACSCLAPITPNCPPRCLLPPLPHFSAAHLATTSSGMLLAARAASVSAMSLSSSMSASLSQGCASSSFMLARLRGSRHSILWGSNRKRGHGQFKIRVKAGKAWVCWHACGGRRTAFYGTTAARGGRKKG